MLALTKLDIISYMKEVPICVAYDVNGVQTTDFPVGEALNVAKPVYEYMEGWNCDISACRKAEDLPHAALAYIKRLENLVGCKIKYVSVGAERDAYIAL